MVATLPLVEGAVQTTSNVKSCDAPVREGRRTTVGLSDRAASLLDGLTLSLWVDSHLRSASGPCPHQSRQPACCRPSARQSLRAGRRRIRPIRVGPSAPSRRAPACVVRSTHSAPRTVLPRLTSGPPRSSRDRSRDGPRTAQHLLSRVKLQVRALIGALWPVPGLQADSSAASGR